MPRHGSLGLLIFSDSGELLTTRELRAGGECVGADLPPVRAHGWIVKSGRRAAFAEADVRTVDGDLLATASSTCLVFPIPAA